MIIEREEKTVSPNKSGQNLRHPIQDNMVEESPISTDLYLEESVKKKWKPLHYEAFAELDNNLNLFSYVFHHPDEQLSSEDFSKEEEDTLLMNALDIFVKNEDAIVKKETKARASGNDLKYLQKRIENSDSSSILNFLKFEAFLEFFRSCKPGFSPITPQQEISSLIAEKQLGKYTSEVKRRIQSSKYLKELYERKKPQGFGTKLWMTPQTSPTFLEQLKRVCEKNSLLRISDMQIEETEEEQSPEQKIKSPKPHIQRIDKVCESKPIADKKKPSPPKIDAILLDKNTSTKENTLTMNLENAHPKEIPSPSPSPESSISGVVNRRYVRLSRTKLKNQMGKLSDDSNSASDDGTSAKKSNLGEIFEKYGLVNKKPDMIEDYDSEPEKNKHKNFKEDLDLDLKPFFSEISSFTGSNSDQGPSDFFEDSASEINGLLKEMHKVVPKKASKETERLLANTQNTLKRKANTKRLEKSLPKKLPKLLNKNSKVPKPKATRGAKLKKLTKIYHKRRRRGPKKLIEGVVPLSRVAKKPKKLQKPKEAEITTNKNAKIDKSIDESSSLEDFIVEDSMMIEGEGGIEQEIVTEKKRPPPTKLHKKRKEAQGVEKTGPTTSFFIFKKRFATHLETHLNNLLDSHLKCPEKNLQNLDTEYLNFLPLNFDTVFNGLNVNDDIMRLEKLLNGLCALSPIIKTMMEQLDAMNLNFLQQQQNFLNNKQLYSIVQLSEDIKVKLRSLQRFWPKNLSDLTSNKSMTKVINKIDAYLCSILRLEVINPIMPVILRNRNLEYAGRSIIEHLLVTNLENLFIIFDIFSSKLSFTLKEFGILWRVYAKLGLRLLPCCYLQTIAESSVDSEHEQKQAATKRSFKILLMALRGSPEEVGKNVILLAQNFLENFQRFVNHLLLNEQLSARFADSIFDESKIWKFLMLSTHEFIEETQQNSVESDKLILQSFNNIVNTFVLVDALGFAKNINLWNDIKYYQKEVIQEIKLKTHKILISCGIFIFDVFCELEPESTLKEIKKAKLLDIFGVYLDQIQTFEELGRFNSEILLKFIREIKPSTAFFFKYYEISKKLLREHLKKLEAAALDQFILAQKPTFSQYSHAVASITNSSSSMLDLKAENIILIASALFPWTFGAETSTSSTVEAEKKLRQLVSKSMGLISSYKLETRLNPEQAAQLLLNYGLFFSLIYTTARHPEMLQGILLKLYSFIADPEKSNIYGKTIVMSMFHEVIEFVANKLSEISCNSLQSNKNCIEIYTNAINNLIQRSNKVLLSLMDDSTELSRYVNIFEGPGSADFQMNTHYMRLQGLLDANFLSLKIFAKERLPIIIKYNINLFSPTPKVMAVLNPRQPFIKSVRKSLLGLLTELLIENSEFERRNANQNKYEVDIEDLGDQDIDELLELRQKFLDQRREFVNAIQKDYMQLFIDTIYSLFNREILTKVEPRFHADIFLIENCMIFMARVYKIASIQKKMTVDPIEQNFGFQSLFLNHEPLKKFIQMNGSTCLDSSNYISRSERMVMIFRLIVEYLKFQETENDKLFQADQLFSRFLGFTFNVILLTYVESSANIHSLFSDFRYQVEQLLVDFHLNSLVANPDLSLVLLYKNFTGVIDSADANEDAQFAPVCSLMHLLVTNLKAIKAIELSRDSFAAILRKLDACFHQFTKALKTDLLELIEKVSTTERPKNDNLLLLQRILNLMNSFSEFSNEFKLFNRSTLDFLGLILTDSYCRISFSLNDFLLSEKPPLIWQINAKAVKISEYRKLVHIISNLAFIDHTMKGHVLSKLLWTFFVGDIQEVSKVFSRISKQMKIYDIFFQNRNLLQERNGAYLFLKILFYEEILKQDGIFSLCLSSLSEKIAKEQIDTIEKYLFFLVLAKAIAEEELSFEDKEADKVFVLLISSQFGILVKIAGEKIEQSNGADGKKASMSLFQLSFVSSLLIATLNFLISCIRKFGEESTRKVLLGVCDIIYHLVGRLDHNGLLKNLIDSTLLKVDEYTWMPSRQIPIFAQIISNKDMSEEVWTKIGVILRKLSQKELAKNRELDSLDKNLKNVVDGAFGTDLLDSRDLAHLHVISNALGKA